MARSFGKTEQGRRATRTWIVRGGGLAAAVGGIGWIAKGGTILVGGPDWLQVGYAGLMLFPLGMVALAVLVGPRGGRLGAIGRWLVAISFAALAVGAVSATSAAGFSEQVPLVSRVALGTAGGTLFVSLLLLGIVTWRVRPLPAPLHVLPLAIGAGGWPFMYLAAAILGPVDEGLIEIPIVVLGAAFVGLGYGLWRAPDVTPRETHLGRCRPGG